MLRSLRRSTAAYMAAATTMRSLISRLEVVVPLSLLPPTPTSLHRQYQISPKRHTILCASFNRISPPTLTANNSTPVMLNSLSINSLTYLLTPLSLSLLIDCLIYVGQQQRNGVYIVGDFMTTKQDLHVVNSTTTVEQGINIYY